GERRAESPQVARRFGVGQVVDVVTDLVRDAERFAVAREDFEDGLVRAGVDRPELERDLESGRGLLAKDPEHVDRSERLGMARPPELASLTEAERAMAARGAGEHRDLAFGGGLAFGEQTIALADEPVADVEGDGHAVLFVKRSLAVALAIAILDVVVDERRLVEALDRGGGFPELAGDL